MFTEFKLNTLLGYIGDVAFVIGGIYASKKLNLHWFLQWLSGMSTAFFGGLFLRDLLLLQTTPAIFDSPLEIAATATVGILTVFMFRKRMPGKAFNWLICIIDSVGIAGFTAAGYGRGTGTGAVIAFTCGFVTACGGGIIAAAIRAAAMKSIKKFFETLIDNRWYYVFCTTMSIAYGILHSLGRSTETTSLVLTVIAIIIGLFIEKDKLVRDQRRPYLGDKNN